MAVAEADGRFGGGLVLLRGCPLSGADAFAAAATGVLSRHYRLERQWVADLDNPAVSAAVAGVVSETDRGVLSLARTHLSRQAFALRHPALLPKVRGEIRLFRSPLDVALASHGYLLTIPGTLAEDENRFDAFLGRWLEREGNCSAFGAAAFVGWADLAREALEGQSVSTWPAVDVAFDDLARGPAAVAADALGLPLHDGDLADASVDAVGVSAVASGLLGRALSADAMAAMVADCIARFGDLVNQLIRKRRIGLSIL